MLTYLFKLRGNKSNSVTFWSDPILKAQIKPWIKSVFRAIQLVKLSVCLF